MDEERVEYSFTGDITSLKQATEQAIGLLDKYNDQLTRLTSNDAFGKNAKTAKSFKTSVDATMKSANKLTSKLGSLSDVKILPRSTEAQQLSSGISSVQAVLSTLSSATKLSTAEVRDLTSQLKAAKQSFTDSGAGIEALVQKELKFQKTLDVVRAKSEKMANQMAQMKKKISGAFDPLITKLSSLKNPFAWITKSAQSFKDKAAASFNRVTKIASTCADAFRRVQQSEDAASGAASRSNQVHSGLATVLNRLRNLFKRESEAVSTEEEKLDKKNKTLKESANKHSKLRDMLRRLGSMFKSESIRVSSFTSNLKSMTSISNLARKGLMSLTGVKLGDWLASAVKESINFVENLNLFTVAMGDSVDRGLEFVNTMSDLYGMDPSNLYRYSGYFYQLTDAIGMADSASATLSLSLTKASNDIASLFNVDIQTVVDNLSSGMQGMSRAVRKYGMDIRATTLQQTALAYGIYDQVENMSEANRMALRYLTMMEQVKNATQQVVKTTDGATTIMGDFARTIESPANQLRIFKEQITQLGRAIGNFFVPALQKVLPLINGFIMALRTALTFVATFTGITDSLTRATSGLDAGADAVEEIGNNAAETAKKVKSLLGPFDELNVLSKDSGGAGTSDDLLDPALEAAIANMDLSLESIQMKANQVRDSLLKFFGFDYVSVFNPDTGEFEQQLQWFANTFQSNLIDKFPQWSNTINALFENWAGIVSGLKQLWGSLLGVIDTVFAKISNGLGKLGLDASIAEGIGGLSEGLTKLSGWIDDNNDKLADFILIIAGMVAAFKGLTVVSKLIGPIVSFVSTVATALSGFGTVIAVVAGVVATIGVLYASSESFATSFDGLLQTFWSGLRNMADSVVSLFSTIWGGLKTLWSANIQPMLKQTGDALAPVLQTIGELWTNVSVIFTDVAALLSNLWTTTIQPVLGAFFDAIGSIMAIFKNLWETAVGPILNLIGDGLQSLWTQYLSPVVAHILEAVGGIIELVLNLWNNVLAPLVHFVVKLFGPPITGVFQAIWTVFETAVGIILSAVSVLTGAFSGIIEFLNGVFTGDWKRALSGLANVFVSLGNGIIGVFESVVNFGIGAINSFLTTIVGAVRGAVRGLGGLISDIASLFGYDVDFNVNWSAPQIKKVSIPRIPKVALADGGVVTGPTQALIGEGRYDEAVIPLGNSPQMQDLIDRITDATSKRDDDEPVQVNVYIGNEKVAEYMTRAERKRRLQTNGG